MRKIRIGFPNGVLKLVLNEGEQDENEYVIKSLKSKPYVEANSSRVYLTKEEKAAAEKYANVVKQK